MKKQISKLIFILSLMGICLGSFLTGSTAQARKHIDTGYGQGVEYLQKYADNLDVQQIILVRQTPKKRRLATLYLLEKQNGQWQETLKCGAYIGKKGLGKIKEGDRRTPAGDYGVTMAFGIKDDPGAKMPYTKLTPTMDICGEEENYNQFVDVTKVNHKCGDEGQRLIDYVPQFNYVLFIDYNKEGIFNKGSAIFLHCQGKRHYTYGCVAVTESDMVSIMKIADSNVRICIYK
ncbi:MAG: L,D-transpeptidase family protein [Phascolarctobacterium sp.]|nr:L,D-transpeptidase family protein [Candidatus Phascolarctobacterium equi]